MGLTIQKARRGDGARMLLSAALALLCLIGGPTGAASEAALESGPPSEHEVKALYVYRFLRFVEWPDAERDSVIPLRIGLLHEDPFAGFLHDVVKDRRASDREIIVEVCSLEDIAVRRYDVIFVSAEEMRYASSLLKRLRGTPVLTIGEGDGFLQSGGLINLVRVGTTVKFDVSLASADRSGLTLGSGLLRVARRVIRKS